MSDTQNPSWWLNTSEGFDFSTVTDQTANNSPDVNLSDSQTNYDIVDYINATHPGRARSFLNGIIRQDSTDGFFYLTGNSAYTDPITFTQSKDDLDAGHTISMPLSGGLTDENVTTYMLDAKAINPRGDSTLRVNETEAILQGYSDHGHNSYAYMPNLHVDTPDDHWASGEYISPITQGTGIYTTRMMDHYQWTHSANDARLWVDSAALNGRSYVPAYKSDGITIDEVQTFFNQQKIPGFRRSYKGHVGNFYTGNVNFTNMHIVSNKYAMQGFHHALSMSVKLGSNIAAGEFVPVVMIDRPTWGRSLLGEWNDTKQDNVNWRDARKRLSAMTGSDHDSDDWFKHAVQYHFLTSDSFHMNKRNIKHAIIYIGKPINGNSLGGQYEMRIWHAGFQDKLEGTWYSRKRRTWNTTYDPRLQKIPIDDQSGNWDPSAWTPLFYHAVGSSGHTRTVASFKMGMCRGFTGCWPSARLTRSNYGMALAAFGPGVLDLTPSNLTDTEMHSTIGSSGYSRSGWYNAFGRQMLGGYGWGVRSNGYYLTFLTVPDKVEGIANPNMHMYGDRFQVPENSGDEDNQRNMTYFPQRTVQYEVIGTGSEIVNESQNWEDVDFVIDKNTSTSALAFALGIENDIQVKTKPANEKIHAQLSPGSVVKYLEIELRNIAKKYMNPGLRLIYSLWSYKDPLNPVRLTKDVSIRPKGAAPEDSRLIVSLDLAGQNITYDILNNSRLRIWVEG